VKRTDLREVITAADTRLKLERFLSSPADNLPYIALLVCDLGFEIMVHTFQASATIRAVRVVSFHLQDAIFYLEWDEVIAAQEAV